jgi:peptidase E/L-amino acid N-acyltransferase YncA
MTLLLASTRLTGIADLVPAQPRDAPVVVVPTAANELPDRDAMVASLRDTVDALDRPVELLDLDVATPADLAAVERAAAIVVGGGDPFRLLAAAQRHDFATFVNRALDRGTPYCGISAGAMLAARTLAPVPRFSPFTAPVDFDPRGLDISPLLVLPHDDRDGRRARHEVTQRAFGRDVDMLALRDDEHVLVDGDAWRLRSAGLATEFRFATPDDVPAMAAVFDAAARAAWASFVGADRLAAAPDRTAMFRERMQSGSPRDVIGASDEHGLSGFVWVHASDAHDTGEVDLFYTHPRAWGSGIGRRLMQLGLDELRARGFAQAVLWTEERNVRPRRVYARGGWQLDGVTRERDYLGVTIRELRHRITL